MFDTTSYSRSRQRCSIAHNTLFAFALVLVAGCDKQVPLNSIQADWHRGFFSHDLMLKNSGDQNFEEVDITITLVRDDGFRDSRKRFWAAWKRGETKIVTVSACNYQKLEIEGSAVVVKDRDLERVRFGQYWTMGK